MKRRRGCALLIFTRAPYPGEVKTRLIPMLNAAGAARLQATLLQRVLAEVLGGRRMPTQLWYAGRPHPLLQSLAHRYRIDLRRQQGGDLGARMAYACRAALRRCHAVLMIGSDCPRLRKADLESAAANLNPGGKNCSDVVLGPALDGGYYLLGLRPPRPPLFQGLPWGGPRVLEISLRRCRLMGLRIRLLGRRRTWTGRRTWRIGSPGGRKQYGVPACSKPSPAAGVGTASQGLNSRPRRPSAKNCSRMQTSHPETVAPAATA